MADVKVPGWPKVAPPAPIDANEGLKKGHYVYLAAAKVPCKIDNVKTSKTGKHGHAKKVVKGYPVMYSVQRENELSKKCVEEVFSSHAHPTGFAPVKVDWLLMGIDDETISCMNDEDEVVDFPFPTDSTATPSACFLELMEKFKANDEAGGEMEYNVNIMFLPLIDGKVFGEISCFFEGWSESTPK